VYAITVKLTKNIIIAYYKKLVITHNYLTTWMYKQFITASNHIKNHFDSMNGIELFSPEFVCSDI